MKQRKYHNETEPKQTKAYEDNVGYIHESICGERQND